MKTDSPELSIAMIVKDEEDNLQECLKQIKPFADEICIVDTGSSDNTVEILKSAEVKWKQIPWPENFSSARNESLRLCSGKWVFIIDADERISSEDMNKIKALASQEPTSAYRMWTKNYTQNTYRSDFQHVETKDDPYALGFPGWFPSAKVRLFPNHPQIRFHGAVHETVLPSLLQLKIPVLNYEDIWIHHYGERREPERIKKKQQQYLLLGLQKINEEQENPQAFAELAAQLAELGNYPQALEYYRRAIELDHNCAEYWGEIGAILFLLGFKSEAEQALKLALRINPSLYSAWKNLAIVYIKSEKWNHAVSTLQKCSELKPLDTEILNALSFVFTMLNDQNKAQEIHTLLRDLKCHQAKMDQILNNYMDKK